MKKRNISEVGVVTLESMADYIPSDQRQCRACSRITNTMVKAEPNLRVPCDQKCFQSGVIDPVIIRLHGAVID